MNKLTQKIAAVTAAAAFSVAGLSLVQADEKADKKSADESAQTASATEKQPIPESMTWINQLKGEQKETLAAMVGQPAPKLTLSDGFNGEPMTNDDLKGKITIVDVWATWCPPCIAAIPKNNKVFAKYEDEGVVVLGVTSHGNGQEKLPEMVKKHDIQYPVFTDPTLETMAAWNTPFFPSYYVVDRDGIVRGVVLDPNKVEDVVKLLLKEQPNTATASAE